MTLNQENFGYEQKKLKINKLYNSAELYSNRNARFENVIRSTQPGSVTSEF